MQQLRLLPDDTSQSDGVMVKISVASAKLLFVGCTVDYISSVCHGRCCDSSDKLSVAIHSSEQALIESKGGMVVNGLLQPNSKGLCPFKWESGLCTLHGTGFKPFGCVASPFTLNKKNTLIVRNRYKLLKCYKGGTIPAYRAFDSSLFLLFEEEAQAIIDRLDNGNGDFIVSMPYKNYQILKDNTETRRKYATAI